MKIVISRTDSIGDVVLTLPLVGLLRRQYPNARIVFLGRSYTLPVLQAYPAIDEHWDWDELSRMPQLEQTNWLKAQQVTTFLHVFPRKELARWAKQAGVPIRIGTRSRLYHWFTCNRLVKLHRRNSPLHEAQLNIKLAIPHLMPDLAVPTLAELKPFAQLVPQDELPPTAEALLTTPGPHYVLHPKSQGSGREWPLERFEALAHKLIQKGAKVYISGTAKEGAELRPWIEKLPPSVNDITGTLTLGQFITFLSKTTGIVANSTGPLHLGSAVGIRAVGLYPPVRPIHPGRWAPVGANALALAEGSPACSTCQTPGIGCACIAQISETTVIKALTQSTE